MAKTRRNAYDAAFKLKAIDLAVGKGNRAAARELGLNESMRRIRGGPYSWRVRTSLCQQLPPDYEEKVSNFHKFTDAKIAEHSIGPHDIINMDEVPMTFDLPLTRTVNRKGESSVTLKTTGHEKTHFICVLSCTALGEKLPPMVIFKRTTMPKEKFP
ncbi:unnamed protein product [Leuciscus chuanchicus]